jgi:hypothetical protein
MFLFLLACATVSGPAPVTDPVGSVATAEGLPPPVSFAPLEERVNALIAETQDADRRDRLNLARELMVDMRNKDPIAQRKVFDYFDQVIRIEERARPEAIGFEPLGAPIEEEVIPVPPPAAPPAALAEARTALAGGRYLDAVALLASLSSPEAQVLRKEAVDGWARTERERAGHQFIEARQLAPGNERITALRTVRRALVSINERFPDNAYAAQIAENITKVDADLVAVGAKP